MAKEKTGVSVNATGVDTKARAKIEAERGIVRNEKGEIVLSKTQKRIRIAILEGKIVDYQKRIENAATQIEALKA